jgi:hypothetical protein
MCQMLRDGETDIAVILTEGIVKISLPEITANCAGLCSTL